MGRILDNLNFKDFCFCKEKKLAPLSEKFEGLFLSPIIIKSIFSFKEIFANFFRIAFLLDAIVVMTSDIFICLIIIFSPLIKDLKTFVVISLI